MSALVGVHVARILAENGYRVVGHDLNRAGELAFYPEVEKAITFVRGDVTQMSHLLETVERHQYRVQYDLRAALEHCIDIVRGRSKRA